MPGVGIGIWRRARAGAASGLGAAPDAPSIVADLVANWAAPNIPAWIISGDLATGDTIRQRWSQDPTFTTGVFSGTALIDATADAANSIGISTGALADGTWYSDVDIERPGHDTSAKSVAASATFDTTAPTITTASTANNAENSMLAIALTANETVTWSIVGGADQARFEISGTTLRWASNGTKDYEIPDDADTNNTYIVTVRATDTSSNTTDKTITVTVTDVVESTLKVGLVSYYEFSSTGNLLVDAHGTNTLTNHGAVTSGSAPPLVAGGNYAQLTSASSQWLSCASNASLKVGGTDFSLNFWMYLDGLGALYALSKIGGFGLSEYLIERQFTGGAHKMVFTVFDSSNAADVVISSTALSVTTLYMVTCTYTASSKRLAISINNGTEDTTTGIRTVNASGSGPLNIGNGNDSTSYWNGREYKTGFWKKVLSASEITQLYNSGGGRTYASL